MTYDPANSFSSAERIRALLDPVFISEQGLAKAIALHDAYFGLVGRVSAPANLLWEGRSIPKKISDLTCVKSGNNVVLAWTVPTKNIYNEDLAVTHCQVYRGTTPNFVAGPSNLLADDVVGTTYTDTDALLATTVDYYYRVLGKSSGLAPVSNMGYKLNKALTYYPGYSDTNFISVPYRFQYSKSNTFGPTIPHITAIKKFNPITGTLYSQAASNWARNTFDIYAGDMLSIVVNADSAFAVVGAHNLDTVLSLIYYTHPPYGNGIQYVSLPFDNNYIDAAALLADIPNCYQVGKFDTSTEVTHVWPAKSDPIENPDYEVVENFTIVPGCGYRIRLSADSTWKPKVY